MNAPPVIRLSTPADRDAILAFVQCMNFNPRDAVTWDGLDMIAVTAWVGGELIGAVPMEPRPFRVSSNQVIQSLHETVVAVAPEHRRGGIGSRMQQAISDLRPGGAEVLTVFREQPDGDAYRWYLRNGFSKVMAIESWLHDEPGKIAQPLGAYSWDVNDPRLPWPEIDVAWARNRAGGLVDRTTRGLREWLAIHPYRKRYAFNFVTDGHGNWALVGSGMMHSDTPRAEVMELMLATDDPAACESVVRAVAAFADRDGLAPLRLPLAASDPRGSVLRELGFRSAWPFDMLARPLAGSLPTDTLNAWRYAAVDYI